jgi:hypothetical protein
MCHSTQYATAINGIYVYQHTVPVVTLNTATDRPTDALNKIQFVTHINLLHVSTLGCHSQGDFQLKIQSQPLIWLLRHRRWNNENIKILEF